MKVTEESLWWVTPAIAVVIVGVGLAQGAAAIVSAGAGLLGAKAALGKGKS